LVVGRSPLGFGKKMSAANAKPKRLVISSGIVALVLLAFSTVYLVHYYGETRPTVAQPDAGRTHSATIHSRTVYLTNGEFALAMGTHVLAIAAIGVFIGLLLRARCRKA
jgi:hypothetical protein